MTVQPSKDETREHPVASAWRPALHAFVEALRQGASVPPIPRVEPVSPKALAHMRGDLAAYGETLAPLPEATWSTSVASWQGTHWVILVDLWTVESGRSDLVLHAEVREDGDSYRITPYLVYVP